MKIELCPDIPEDLVEFLEQTFNSGFPRYDEVNEVFNSPLYRAGVGEVIQFLRNQYHSQQET